MSARGAQGSDDAAAGEGRGPHGVRRLASGFAHAEESPGLLLWQVTNRWQAAQRAALKPYELTHVQFVLLASLSWLQAEGPVTQKRLADHASTDPMMTSQVLRTLESRGLVERMPHPHDGRARALAVTAEGRALADQAVAVVEACDAAFFAALGDGVGAFARAMRVLKGAAQGY
ncbi:MarR family winged helix-turn-helix transcriptional regulator [Yinghuangia seranimata]|uniref:MarR family winged helix-turn-helix transcriptional regulator n=1 Tax=Yinghuangia seranimata TaxID=408067 RepID=UPI00248BC0DE|nr:MarR family transcriptional regulator [Yinghuangia seranimata]MDI2128136.1 MarR family transcriptional regulator [Yinghuangia seranimata]